MSVDEPEISIRGLGKSFGTHRVLSGIDLDIERGEVVALVGGSGSGKTVLLNCILGQVSPDEGEIWVADHSRRNAPLRQVVDAGPEFDRLHEHWGVVFQRNALFSGTVLDNIALGLAEVRHLDSVTIADKARWVLAAVGLPVDSAFLARDQAALSGGMAKRLAVARALALEPNVIFYDEPTSGLDPASAAQIHQLILDTHEVRAPALRTSFIITHDRELLAGLRPRTVMLHEARVYFDGPFQDFETSRSPVIQPYFDRMPLLHTRNPGEPAPL